MVKIVDVVGLFGAGVVTPGNTTISVDFVIMSVAVGTTGSWPVLPINPSPSCLRLRPTTPWFACGEGACREKKLLNDRQTC